MVLKMSQLCKLTHLQSLKPVKFIKIIGFTKLIYIEQIGVCNLTSADESFYLSVDIF